MVRLASGQGVGFVGDAGVVQCLGGWFFFGLATGAERHSSVGVEARKPSLSPPPTDPNRCQRPVRHGATTLPAADTNGHNTQAPAATVVCRRSTCTPPHTARATNDACLMSPSHRFGSESDRLLSVAKPPGNRRTVRPPGPIRPPHNPSCFDQKASGWGTRTETKVLELHSAIETWRPSVVRPASETGPPVANSRLLRQSVVDRYGTAGFMPSVNVFAAAVVSGGGRSHRPAWPT